ncbi:hypothetical protein D3C85_1713550 [compost metagenome]
MFSPLLIRKLLKQKVIDLLEQPLMWLNTSLVPIKLCIHIHGAIGLFMDGVRLIHENYPPLLN